MTQQPQKELVGAEAYLMPADSTKLRCVDERIAKDTVNNGVAVPGATYGIIDAIKMLASVDEETAWTIAREAKIPINGHTDEHHGAQGCGYGKLVELEPGTVLAYESVPAENRKARIEQGNGEILTLLGDHHPTEAIVNYKEGTTIDTKRATEGGRGIFCFDAWAMPEMAQKLHLDPDTFANHMLNVYKKTVTKLTGITEFQDVA